MHYLLLYTATSILIATSAVAVFAAPAKIAQVSTVGNINRPTLKIGSQGDRVSELQAALKLLGFYTGAVDGVYQEGTARAVSQFKQAAGLNPDGVVDAITWQKLFPGVSTVATITSSNPVPPISTGNFTVPTRVNNTLAPKPTAPKPSVIARNQNNTAFQPTPLKQQNPSIQYTAEGWPILRLGNRGSEVVKLQKLLQNLGFLKGSIDGDFGATTEAALKAAQIRYGLTPDGIAGGATWEAFIRRLPQQR
ncbi:peptidoglycan-binding protein [Sphaerospermopsis aphanizomenoides BCCUSP55]|uniref:peptidoglycan-binding domain-containing protein n=1 Tax=Sphaerospermopsis aphanizomenoides TaxID=459663 RepID=UPI0019082C21|nr:peptidoglycan-binding protein [Sphaerospermopsis aphanizomenoides]MBK1986456.1 peptidoglycan-binding protein [Sphaerospermopsis aphanizomenoides BCCUSP55]